MPTLLVKHVFRNHLFLYTQQLRIERERQGRGSEIEEIWNNQERLRRVQEEGGAPNRWVAEVIDSPDNGR